MNRQAVAALQRSACCFLLLLAVSSAWPQSEKVTVTRRAVPVAVVRDRPTINFFVDQYFIKEDVIDSLLVIDITDNGFDERDVLEIYPTKRIVNLDTSGAALDTMSTWQRTGFIKLTGGRNEKGQIVVRDRDYPVAQEFFHGLVRLVEQTYNFTGRKLSLFFEFDDVNGLAGLQIWGFADRREMKEKPKSIDQFAHDLLFFTRADTVYVNKPVYDVIYIEQIDTVFVTKDGGE